MKCRNMLKRNGFHRCINCSVHNGILQCGSLLRCFLVLVLGHLIKYVPISFWDLKGIPRLTRRSRNDLDSTPLIRNKRSLLAYYLRRFKSFVLNDVDSTSLIWVAHCLDYFKRRFWFFCFPCFPFSFVLGVEPDYLVYFVSQHWTPVP